jgi:hypothetical protein
MAFIGNSPLSNPTPTQVSDQPNTSTGSFSVPSGTTAQRPGSVANGAFRYNSTTGAFEGYAAGVWGSIGGGAENGVFYGNDNAITANFTTTANKNYMSVGELTLNSNTVTIVNGSTWQVI